MGNYFSDDMFKGCKTMAIILLILSIFGFYQLIIFIIYLIKHLHVFLK